MALGNAVSRFGDQVAGAIETVGNGVNDRLDAIAGGLERTAFGSLGAFLLRWAGAVVSAGCDLVASAAKAVTGIASGAIEGAIGAGIGGALVCISGKAVAFLQVTLCLQRFPRRLNPDEAGLFARVFQRSVALHDVRLVSGRYVGVFSINDRAFVLGNTIYLKDVDPHDDPDVLVHECTHVWQYQHLGARYAAEALAAQAAQGRAAYDWRRELANGRTRWVEFNREAQAQLIQDIFNLGELLVNGVSRGSGKGIYFDADGVKTAGVFVVDGVDHSDLAADAVSTIRMAASARWSIGFTFP